MLYIQSIPLSSKWRFFQVPGNQYINLKPCVMGKFQIRYMKVSNAEEEHSKLPKKGQSQTMIWLPLSLYSNLQSILRWSPSLRETRKLGLGRKQAERETRNGMKGEKLSQFQPNLLPSGLIGHKPNAQTPARLLMTERVRVRGREARSEKRASESTFYGLIFVLLPCHPNG